MQQQVYFVGSETEIAHHAAPLTGKVPFQIIPPNQISQVAKPGDLAIFYSEHFDRFRNAIGELKRSNVATLYMIDGILEWRNAWENEPNEPACPFAMRPVLSHKAACIGYSQARILSHWGNSDKIEIVGVPRFDRLRNLKKRTPKEKKRILIMTAKCPSFTEQQRQKVVASLNDLRMFFASQTLIEPVWRLTAGLDEELGIENQISDLSGAELSEILQQVDAVITTPSTAVLEAMILELPTAIVDYTNSPAYLQTAWSISANCHLSAVVNDLINPSPNKMHFQRQQLKFELMTQGNAADRLAVLIGKMLQLAKTALQSNKPLEFEKNILPLNLHQEAKFDHGEIYSGFPEFQTNDLVETQAELAHARREITHLQNQLAQVRSELGQAHQIFDEINNHPVAGPIVKIRGKIIDVIAKLKASKSQPSADQS